MTRDLASLVSDNLDVWTGAVERTGRGSRSGGKRSKSTGVERLRALIFEVAASGQLLPGESSAFRKLGDHADFIMGQAPPGSSCNKEGRGTPFVKTGEFGELYPNIREWTTRPLKLAKHGDVLICVVGATIGKLNLAIDCAIGRSVAAIRPRHGLDTKYLYYALMPYTLKLRRNARGSAQGVIGKAELRSVQIRVVSLAEQRKIVDKIDELMDLCDALEEESSSALDARAVLLGSLLSALTDALDTSALQDAWQLLEENFDALLTGESSIDELKQSVYELAVRGRLTVTAVGRRSSVAEAAAESVRPPFRVPGHWRWFTLERLGRQVGGGTPSKTRSDFWAGEVPWVSPKDMKRDYIEDAELHISESAIAASAVKPIRPASLLFVVRGMILAHSFPVAVTRTTVTINQDMRAVELHDPQMAEYLLRALKGLKPFMLAQVGRSSHGTCRLDASVYNEFPIPIPPFEEQQRLVAKVDELVALCDTLKAAIAEAAATQRALADAIVEKAAA